MAEFFHEAEFIGSKKASALVGAIWSVRPNLSLDLGVRGAIVDDPPVAETRFAFDRAGGSGPAHDGS